MRVEEVESIEHSTRRERSPQLAQTAIVEEVEGEAKKIREEYKCI